MKQGFDSRHIPPSNGWSRSYPCRFEPSPPFQHWSFCRPSLYQMSTETIRYLHYHMEMEIGLCLSGEGQLYLGDFVIPFRAGDVQIILPYQTHYNIASVADTKWVFICYDPTSLQSPHISPDTVFLEHILSECSLCGIFPADRFPILAQSMTALSDPIIHPTDDPYEADCFLTELLHFMQLLARTKGDGLNSTQQINTEYNRLMPALIAFSKNLEKDTCLTVTEMADICHFSPSYFRKRFSELMGTSPKHFIIREQVRRAALLLVTTDLPISEIQTRVGFADPSSFFRNFSGRYHLSPSAYRKKHAGESHITNGGAPIIF